MGTKKYASETLVTHSFKDLKKIIRRRKTSVSHKTKAAEKVKCISDEELFFDAMKEVEEIEEFRNIPVRQKISGPSVNKRSSDQEDEHILRDIITGRRGINLPDTQEFVAWIHRDYGEDIVEKLHEGRYSIQDSLDIHGLIMEEAEIEIDKFIREALKRGYRCIKIIHGRGLRSPNGPVLKKAVVKWLLSRYRKKITAFVSARQCDGGLGALYVLLR